MDIALQKLRDNQTCPVCGGVSVYEQRCTVCGSDFTGAIGAEIWDASRAAADLLSKRQRLIADVPIAPQTRGLEASVTPVARPAPGQPDAAALPEPEGASATLQSVLAVAGAALVAIAAIVFTFFNEDLSDAAVRNLIVGATTVLFALGARGLSRRRLQFSAEAVGALAILFLALDVFATASLATPLTSEWVFIGVSTTFGGALSLALAVKFRIRIWLWSALTALAFVPAMLGAAHDSEVGSTLGWLTTAAAAFALLQCFPRLVRAAGNELRPEDFTLTTIQLLAIAAALVTVTNIGTGTGTGTAMWSACAATCGAITVLALVSTVHTGRAMWGFISGVAGTATMPLAAIAFFSLFPPDSLFWYVALLPASAVAGMLLLTAGIPLPPTAQRGVVLAGALIVVGIVSAPSMVVAAIIGISALFVRGDSAGLTSAMVTSTTLGLASLAAGLWVLPGMQKRVARRVLSVPAVVNIGRLRSIGQWTATLAALTLLCTPAVAGEQRIITALVLACGVGIALSSRAIAAAISFGARLPAFVGAHLALLLATVWSWNSQVTAISAGVVAIVALALLGRALPAAFRFMHVGIGYAYALVVLAAALELTGMATIAVFCVTTTVGGVGAIAATFSSRVKPRAWYAILIVTSVLFVTGVAQVLFERSGWTALSTGVIFLLALTLVATRRAGLSRLIRVAAAAALVPSLAVVAVCLGAQLLVTSGSPVVLPVIATIVAVTLALTQQIRVAIEKRAGRADAKWVGLAIEGSALLTAALTVLLSLTRSAAGTSTALVVLLILGVGTAIAAYSGGRTYAWAVSGAAFTGALWCGWAIANVFAVEPYLIPPALGMATVGAVLTARGHSSRALYTSGLSLAVVPILGVLALGQDSSVTPWRAYGLVATAWLLAALASTATKIPEPWRERMHVLRAPTFTIGIVAGAAGAVQSVRWGLGVDVPPASTVPFILLAFALALAGTVPAALCARGLRAGAAIALLPGLNRWLYAPAFLYVAVGTWPAIQRDWFTIWSMWALMCVFLTTMVAVAWRAHTTALPPVWFLFVLSFTTAIVAWSPRDLRVEWFSLPLGAFLLATGALALRRRVTELHLPARVTNWPNGWQGSWPLLAPGLVVLLSASVAATYTDPLTWRAILVIVIALGCILVGARARLAAPFLIGIFVLPVENVLAFAVQIGRGIDSMPWWITLAIVGAVLLIIAVSYERRAGEEAGIAARLRDLS
ncbi:hypothetical protein FHX48_001622 [Microbacterium halimionae]|uniref:DUF2157 domain-containing protein n=1 Tax=Microbacterium halimionae TaxID=1526413 RepID=A0A7W3JPB7_9MICO|nr:hypothetical protein [Microbacterium halimionae]MBA8816549.1 hypothetical protein [Microbacterium halimionae]NII95264.1 hypothetical protein [Microbacterium halimionae]